MPNANSPNTLSRLKTSSKERLASLVWRLDATGEWHSLANRNSAKAQPSSEKKTYLVALLARNSYQESWASYTIRSARALAKVLDLKRKSNEFYYMGPWQNGKRLVLTIQLDPRLAPELQKAKLVFPETLILGETSSQGFYQIESSGLEYFLHKKSDGSWQTILSSKLINSSEKAKLALGCSAEVKEHKWDETQLRERLAEAIFKLAPSYWAQGWQSQQRLSNQSFPWKKLIVGVAGIGAVYLLCMSLYLYGYSMMSERRLAQITPQVSDVLTQQDKLQRTRQQLTQLAANLMDGELLNQYWVVVATAHQLKASVDYSNYNGETLSIGGQADDALEVLRKLHELPEVASAEFGTPLRNSRGRQQFRIEITLSKAKGAQS